MSFQIGGVDHHGFLFVMISGQTCHHPGEDALVAPSLPAVVERLVRAVSIWRIPSPKPIAIDEDNAIQDMPVIDARFAVGFREVGLKTSHLRVAQPE